MQASCLSPELPFIANYSISGWFAQSGLSGDTTWWLLNDINCGVVCFRSMWLLSVLRSIAKQRYIKLIFPIAGQGGLRCFDISLCWIGNQLAQRNCIMLTITRTNSLPTLLIGDDIKLHITIEDGKAKAQIDAPKDIKIQRGELRWRSK